MATIPTAFPTHGSPTASPNWWGALLGGAVLGLMVTMATGCGGGGSEGPVQDATATSTSTGSTGTSGDDAAQTAGTGTDTTASDADSSSGNDGTEDSGDSGDPPLPPGPVHLDPETDEFRFAPTRGFFDAPIDVAITTSLPGAMVRYTVDGSTPTAELGMDYTGPIAVTTTSMLRAVVIQNGVVRTIQADDGGQVPHVRTHSYIFVDDVIQQGDLTPDGDEVFWTTEMDPEITLDPAYSGQMRTALLDIPTLSVVADPEELFGYEGIHRGQNLEADLERVASLELIYASDDSFQGFQEDAGIKIQGGGGRWDHGHYDHKQSFSLRFRGVYGASKLRYPTFESAPSHAQSAADKHDKLILRAGHNKSWGATWDPEHTAFTRDQLGRDLQIEASGHGSHGTFLHLYLNGQYWGLYNLVERPDDAFAARYFGGSSDDYYAGKHKGGDVDGDPARYQQWLNEVASGSDFTELQAFLDVDAYIDMALINVYAATGDFPQYYYTVANVPPGPVRFWNWDLEDAFGGDSRRSSDDPQTDRLDSVYRLSDIYGNMPQFRDRWKERATTLTADGGTLSDTYVNATWLGLNDFIALAVIAESARWGDERMNDDEHEGDFFEGTGRRFSPEDWQNAVDLVTQSTGGKAERLVDALQASGYWE